MNTRKVVINTSIGGFKLRIAALRRYTELKGLPLFIYYPVWATQPDKRGSGFIRFEENTHNYEWAYYVTQDAGDHPTMMTDATLQHIRRDDPALVQVVEELGDAAGQDCTLRIVTIPADVKWHIAGDDDVSEWVAEDHRTWGAADT